MNEQSVGGIECRRREARFISNAESVAGKKHYLIMFCVTAFFLLLIGSVLTSPLCAAVTDAQKAAITAGVAAGTDIKVIVQNALASGMTLEQAIQELVKSGADPGRVVFEAITAGYSAQAVVKSAAAAALNKYCPDNTVTTIACSSQVTAIISAAQQTGASSADINGWLAGAGVPATLIASANTGSQGQPPAEGYTGPAGGVALTSIVGGGGGAIGGSSIGSPLAPTQPASPSKP